MSFSNQLSREMALDQYSDQNVDANYVISGGRSQQQQPQPTWYNSQSSNFLNLQTTPKSNQPSGIIPLSEEEEEEVQRGDWQNAKLKGELLAHPLYDQLLAAHVACLRIATPVDQLPRINAQLTQSQQVVAKYSALGGTPPSVQHKDLDHFMVITKFYYHDYNKFKFQLCPIYIILLVKLELSLLICPRLMLIIFIYFPQVQVDWNRRNSLHFYTSYFTTKVNGIFSASS